MKHSPPPVARDNVRKTCAHNFFGVGAVSKERSSSCWRRWVGLRPSHFKNISWVPWTALDEFGLAEVSVVTAEGSR